MMSGPTKKSSTMPGRQRFASFRAASSVRQLMLFRGDDDRYYCSEVWANEGFMSKRPLCQCGSAHRVRDTLDTEESARM